MIVAPGPHPKRPNHRRDDCRSALRAISNGSYIVEPAFFAHLRRRGYRHCGVCMPDAYRAWKTRT